MLAQIGIGLAEVVVSEKAVISRKRRRVRRSEHKMPATVDKGTFSLRISSPQDEHQMLALLGQQAYDSIGKGFPTAV